MMVDVHTLRYGEHEWLSICAPTLDRWCKSHGYGLRVHGDTFPQYPTPKFCAVDILTDFLSGPSDWMMWVDADVFVMPDTPSLDMLDMPGFHAATDQYHDTHTDDWRDWCQSIYGERPPERYRNAAVWLCDRDAATMMLAEAKPPYIEALMEEYQWNWWLVNAMRKGMKFNYLSDKWNHSPKGGSIPDGTRFCHFWGTDKTNELLAMRERLGF